MALPICCAPATYAGNSRMQCLLWQPFIRICGVHRHFLVACVPSSIHWHVHATAEQLCLQNPCINPCLLCVMCRLHVGLSAHCAGLILSVVYGQEVCLCWCMQHATTISAQRRPPRLLLAVTLPASCGKQQLMLPCIVLPIAMCWHSAAVAVACIDCRCAGMQ